GRDFAEFAESTDTLTTAEAEAQALKGKTSLRTAILDPSGSVSGETVLDPRVCDCCPTTAVTTTSGVLVAYRDPSHPAIPAISLVRLVGGRWTGPYPLHRDGWKIVGCPVSGPALDADGDHVVAAWYSAAQNKDRVFAAFSDDGGKTFSAPRRVDLGNPLGRVD